MPTNTHDTKLATIWNLAWVACAVVLTAGCAAHFLGGYYFWGKSGFAFGNDDAFISFRYAVNLVDHGVLSYNLDDNPRVEGYSNPLHVLVAIVAYGAGVSKDHLYPLMALLGALAAVAALILTMRHVQRTLGNAAAVGVGAVMALSPSIWVHATSGLETSFVLLAQCVIWIAAVSAAGGSRRGPGAALVAATVVLVLLRTDGFVFPVIAATWLLLAGRARVAVAMLACAAAVFVAVALARYGYYQEWLPNTYYAKLNGALVERVAYAVRLLASIGLKSGMLVLFIFAALAGVAWATQVARSARLSLPSFELTAIAGLVAYYLLIGADIYRERFLLIIFPLGAMLMARMVLSRPAAQGKWAGLVALTIALQLAALKLDPKFEYDFRLPKHDQWVFLGRYLALHHPEATLATGAAGKIPYFSGLRTIDTLGLNDHHIARTLAKSSIPGHGRFDLDYVFDREPDLIAEHAYGDGHLAWGFTHDVYEARGYRLTYLLRREDRTGEPIVKLDETADRETIARLVSAGYTFGVLTRRR